MLVLLFIRKRAAELPVPGAIIKAQAQQECCRRYKNLQRRHPAARLTAQPFGGSI